MLDLLEQEMRTWEDWEESEQSSQEALDEFLSVLEAGGYPE